MMDKYPQCLLYMIVGRLDIVECKLWKVLRIVAGTGKYLWVLVCFAVIHADYYRYYPNVANNEYIYCTI